MNTSEELSDLEGIIYTAHKNEEVWIVYRRMNILLVSYLKVEVEPFVDIKYDIHVQKVSC